MGFVSNFERKFQFLRDRIPSGVEHNPYRGFAHQPKLRSNAAAGLCGDVRQRIELQRNLSRRGTMDLVQCEFYSDGHTQNWRGYYLQQFQNSERSEWDRYQ